jgi:hypothetical protein
MLARHPTPTLLCNRIERHAFFYRESRFAALGDRFFGVCL